MYHKQVNSRSWLVEATIGKEINEEVASTGSATTTGSATGDYH